MTRLPLVFHPGVEDVVAAIYECYEQVAELDELIPAWERYCREAAERHREMGK